ncbi:MAG: TetR family transcriptional regulator C-terminal domain-containing protein [Thermoleophilia bacterium]|nr:TetR family transcriptional regulator C-terminal domain-containing protein [Thermoleophilia bacterium]
MVDPRPEMDAAAGLATRPRRSPNPVANRDKLIEATIRCIATYGPAGATVERITDLAGLSRGLVRHHFGSKQRLLFEAFARLADEMRAAFASADPAEEPDPVGALRTAIANELEQTVASPQRARAWFGFWLAAMSDADLREANERLYTEERERFSELFRVAAQQQGLEIDHTEAGIGLVALVDGAWNELLMEGARFGLDNAYALCDHYIDMVLRQGRDGRGGSVEGACPPAD